MRRPALTAIMIATVLLGVATAYTQPAIRLQARRYSEVELVYGKRSVIFDLDDALIGSNGSMPGNPPHKFRTLFTAERDGFVYLVANVRSGSPVSNPMAACGGDSPQSVLWIKADKTLRTREVRSEIYASCSYNYYDSEMSVSRHVLEIKYGGDKNLLLRYDNREPEKGLVVTRN